MRKDDFCYEQSKKRECLPKWKNKKTSHLTRKEEGLIQIRVLGINLTISPRITTREQILKIKYHRIL